MAVQNFASMVSLRSKLSTLRFGLLAFAVGLLFQTSLVSFHQGRHAAESISRYSVPAQTAVHDLESTECTFCSVLHVAADSTVYAPILVSAFTPESLDAVLTAVVYSKFSLALPGARAPPHSSFLV